MALILVYHHVSEKSWALFAHLAYLWNGILSLIKPIIIIIINCCHNHRKSVLRHLEYDNLSWYVSERYFSSDCRAILLKLDQQMDLPPFIMIILIITSSCQFLWIYQIELCAILGSLEQMLQGLAWLPLPSWEKVAGKKKQETNSWQLGTAVRLIQELMPWHLVQEPKIAFSIAKILAACLIVMWLLIVLGVLGWIIQSQSLTTSAHLRIERTTGIG